MSNLFFSGLEALQQIEHEKARQQANAASRKFLNFFLSDGDQKTIRMLLPQPIVYWAHVFDKGKDKYVCTDHKNGCPLCKSKALNSRPQQRGLMPVRWIDAPTYNDKEQDDILFLWDMNYPPLLAFAQAVSVLKKGDITSADYIVTRAVSGTTSQYGFYRQDSEPFSEKDHKVLSEIPDWSEIIVAPSQDQLNWLLSNQAGYFSSPKSAASKPAAVPKPSYDRKAEAAQQPVAQPLAKAAVAEEQPPFEPDSESPVRPASDFI